MTIQTHLEILSLYGIQIWMQKILGKARLDKWSLSDFSYLFVLIVRTGTMIKIVGFMKVNMFMSYKYHSNIIDPPGSRLTLSAGFLPAF